MVKMLVKHGNSYALVIDKPILELLNITPDTPLEITTLDGKSLVVGPAFDRNEHRTSTLAELESLASSLGPGAGGLMALPYWAGVMNPHWDDDAGGALLGLRAEHGPEHVYRAICEGLAFEQRLAFELLEQDVGALSQIVTMGGAARRDFFLRVVTDVLGRPLSRSTVDETTALGAAMLAAPAAGVADSIEAAARQWGTVGDSAVPGADAARYDELYTGAYRGLYEALAPALKVLAGTSNRG